MTPSRSSGKSLGADLPPWVLKGPKSAGLNRVHRITWIITLSFFNFYLFHYNFQEQQMAIKCFHLSSAVQSCLLVSVGQIHVRDTGASRQQDVHSLQNPFYPSPLLHLPPQSAQPRQQGEEERSQPRPRSCTTPRSWATSPPPSSYNIWKYKYILYWIFMM